MKSFSRYLIPSLIASLLFSSFALVDGIFIGQKIGDLGLSAINIAWPITALIQSIGLAIGLSGGIYISRLEGKNNPERASKIRLTTILIISIAAIIVGFIFYLGCENILRMFGAEGETLEYGTQYIKVILIGALFEMLGCGLIPLLKNSKMVKTAMILSIISIVTNLILDYLLIMKANMDLKGAALSSVIGQAVPTIIGLILYRKEFNGIILEKEDIKELGLGSIAPFILSYSYSFIILVTNSFCLKYGGNEAVAAYTLLSYLLYISQALATATGDAIQPLFSYYYEKNEVKRNIGYLRRCLIISLSINLVFVLLVYIFRENLSKLYNLSDKAEEYYLNGLKYYLAGFALLSLYKVICSFTYSINEKLLSNTLIIVEPLLLTPLVYAILTPKIGLTGIWFGFALVQAILLLLAEIIYTFIERRHLLNGWVHINR